MTTVPVTATAAAFILSPSAAAALGLEASQITWSSAPPHWQQLTVAGRQMSW